MMRQIDLQDFIERSRQTLAAYIALSAEGLLPFGEAQGIEQEITSLEELTGLSDDQRHEVLITLVEWRVLRANVDIMSKAAC